MTGEVTLLGIRHHGPGSARAVGAALTELRPDAVLVEGPPEADPIVGLAGTAGMEPPVALLVHAADDPARAAFWPFAAWSPEWVAIRHALDAGVPVRFADLPAGAGFALDKETDEASVDEPSGDDPIARLAAAAGRTDSEAWWEDVVEHRGAEADPLARFAAIAEAMTAVRDDRVGTPGSPGAAPTGPAGRRERLREAHMRQRLRAARRAGHRRIAVVCGAWHVPALAAVDAPGAARVDRELLAGLPRGPRTAAAWVPWTNRRLTQRSGYGAGVQAPGWYQHLFETEPERVLPGWLARAAALLRAADHPVPPAQLIDAVRTAEALAALRGRPGPGLAETMDAVLSVLCQGSEVALALVRERLVVGEAVGRVPAASPVVPLQRDLDRLSRSLRLKPQAEQRELALDLRRELDAGRSRLLHRLRLLGVEWGRPAARCATAQAGSGTFRERWQLRWEPESAVRVVAAAPWGTTVERAATARAAALAAEAGRLAELTDLAERCLAAQLPGALPAVLRALAERAALDTDVAHLAEALPALARALRYGDVRGTDRGALADVARSLADRLCLGLAPACTGLAADGAAAMRDRLEAAHPAIGLLAREGGAALAERWAAALDGLSLSGAVPGLLRGRAVRLLLDDGRIGSAQALLRLRPALSRAAVPADAAGWLEGFLAGGGALLLHDPRLLALLDDWLAGLPEPAFTDLLPLLRRAFAGLEPAVRRGIGERIAAGPVPGGRAGRAGTAEELDEARADAALPTVLRLLGRPAA